MLLTKKRSFVILLSVFILMIGCNQDQLDIENLPELPLARVENLSPSFSGRGFETVPTTYAFEKISSAQTNRAVVGQSCVRTYEFGVVYFHTFCQPAVAINFPNQVVFSQVKPKEKPISEKDTLLKAPSVEFYKLLNYQGKKLNIPEVCRVYSIPWKVTITEEVPCEINLPRRYTFLFDYPENPIAFTWDASSLEEIPLPSDMIKTSDLVFIREVCNCCGPLYWCNGTCIPIGRTCKDPVPQ